MPQRKDRLKPYNKKTLLQYNGIEWKLLSLKEAAIEREKAWKNRNEQLVIIKFREKGKTFFIKRYALSYYF